EPEEPVGMREARRPDTAGVRIAAHVELRGATKRAGEQAPVREIARMMDLHAGEPFEGRGRDVIILPYPHDGRIGIEAAENGISDHAATGTVSTGGASFGAFTSVHRTIAPSRSMRPSAMKNGV